MRTQKKVGTKVTDYYYDSNNNLIVEKTDSMQVMYMILGVIFLKRKANQY